MRLPKNRLPRFQDVGDYMPRRGTESEERLDWIVGRRNGLTEGRASALHAGDVVQPSVGTWAQGDFVRNIEPVEAGAVSSKYIVIGWMCTASGTPGTWVSCRTATGN